MTAPLRSHASVRSYFFREAVAERGGSYVHASDFRDVWREAERKAREWRRQATNRWNPSTRQWEQRQ